MGSTIGESRWSQDTLKEAWIQMFDYSLYQNHYENLDVQCILMLLEGGLSHVKKVLTAYSALKASEKELVSQLEIKTHECWSLKEELKRPCNRCSVLETSLLDARKRAKDAKARMDSIANILRLGENMDPSQGLTRNAAMDLVSQMILGSSPPPKRKKPSPEGVNHQSPLIQDTPEKIEVLAPDTCDILTERAYKGNGYVPSTMQVPHEQPRKPSPSSLNSSSSVTIKGRTAGRSPVLKVNFIPCRSKLTPMSKSFDAPTSSKPFDKTANIKKNLSVDLDNINKKDGAEGSPIKPIVFDLKAGPPPLDDTLKDYVKGSTGKLLANIWFDDDDDDEFELSKKVAGSPAKFGAVPNDESPVVIPETPVHKQKRADFWLLKEKRGPREVSKSTGRRLKQTKLELGTKRKEVKVDLSKLPTPSTSHQQEKLAVVVEDEEIIARSPEGPPNQVNLDQYLSSSQESYVNTTDFKPLASSTQKCAGATSREGNRSTDEPSKAIKPPISDFDRLPSKAAPKEPEYVYAREAVKKKSERQKLDGWDCKECAEYYAAVGKNLNAAEVKERMNACSKHRNKFKPKLNETPPGFWNPLFPSTEEIKGYESLQEKRN